MARTWMTKQINKQKKNGSLFGSYANAKLLNIYI